jgi:chemotaxis protein histidine kinase CheA
MQKKTMITLFAFAVVLGAATFSFAKTGESQGVVNSGAKNTGNATQTQTEETPANVSTPNQNREKNQERNKNNNYGELNREQENNQEQNREKNNSGKIRVGENFGQVNADSHRRVVADFVRSLLAAGKNEEEKGNKEIGIQVRRVAMEQNRGEAMTITAMEQIQTRSKIKTFLFGSDYKNLGNLRSEMVQTRNRIRQLTELMNKAEGEETKQRLQEQIQLLEQEQEKINQFITENESKFSLFGWLVKLFQ